MNPTLTANNLVWMPHFAGEGIKSIPLAYVCPQYCPSLSQPSAALKFTLYAHENIILSSFCVCVCLMVDIRLQRQF